jgi:hypothetical protein
VLAEKLNPCFQDRPHSHCTPVRIIEPDFLEQLAQPPPDPELHLTLWT